MREQIRRWLLHGLAPFADRIWAQRGAILCLHSVRGQTVAEPAFDPLSELRVSPAFLECLLEALRARGVALVSLAEAMRRLSAGKAGRFVALTFDDGYADNWSEAFPLLRRLAVPCTIFLTSGFIDGTVAMWWSDFEAVLCRSDVLQLPGGACIPTRTAAEKWRAFGELSRRLRHELPEGAAGFHRAVMAHNREANSRDTARTALTWDQVRAMAASGLVTFGCHTVSHPVLAKLDPIGAAAEIRGCRERLAEELGGEPVFFAYPYGGEAEIGPIAPMLVAEAGFAAAFTTERRLLRRAATATDPYRVPRLVIGLEDLRLARTHISGLPWALRETRELLMRRPQPLDVAAAL